MDREKLEEMISQTREKAVEVDRAIKTAKRKKKLEEKKKSSAKSLPDPEETYEKIISKGKNLERAILYVHNFDVKAHFGKGILTEAQRTRLRATFKTDKQLDILAEVGSVYDGILEYARFYLYTVRKMWESDAWELVRLCQQWEDADTLADTITRAYYNQILPFVAKMEAEGYTGESPYTEEAFRKYVSEMWTEQKGITPRVEQSGTDDEGRPLFKVVADVDGEGGLYSQLQEKREDAEVTLSTLRGAIEPFSDFLLTDLPLQTGGKIFPYTTIIPHTAESILDFPDSISAMREPRMEKYFSYRLRQRKEAGETITPEEEKRAVIPDYNQAEDDDDFIRAGKRNLTKHLPEYYDPNKDYGKK